jgi:hypothetical protein
MNRQRQQLIDFATRAAGLDNAAKLKLILFAAGVKPATFFALRINPQNLDEKEHLERHLQACKFPFIAGKARGYEQIVNIKGDAVQWKIRGTWYGYDVFADRGQVAQFKKYLSLVQRRKHADADRVGGTLYDYPSCCVEHYVKEHNVAFLRKNYTYFSYYKHLHDTERAFPLLMHTACSTTCAASKKMNALYAATLKKYAPAFWKTFSAARKYAMDVVVDAESELNEDFAYGIASSKPVFAKKDGHEFVLLTLKPVEDHYYLYSFLTRLALKRGTVFPARVTMQYNHATITLGKPKRVIKNLHHERHFLVP